MAHIVKTNSIEGESVSSGSTFTWTGGGNLDLRDYRDHFVAITGASAVATITANMGNGYQAVATLTAPDYDTYLIPNASAIQVAVTGATGTLTMKSFRSVNI